MYADHRALCHIGMGSQDFLHGTCGQTVSCQSTIGSESASMIVPYRAKELHKLISSTVFSLVGEDDLPELD
jgi:hypothetical protein